jgi:hypothetical protein
MGNDSRDLSHVDNNACLASFMQLMWKASSMVFVQIIMLGVSFPLSLFLSLSLALLSPSSVGLALDISKSPNLNA